MGHHHGSHPHTSAEAVLLGKMAYHTKQIRRQCSPFEPPVYHQSTVRSVPSCNHLKKLFKVKVFQKLEKLKTNFSIHLNYLSKMNFAVSLVLVAMLHATQRMTRAATKIHLRLDF